MLAYVDFFLGGDEKRTDLPPRLYERLPMTLLFGGDGSYMAPFTLHNDNILTSLMSQVCLFDFVITMLCIQTHLDTCITCYDLFHCWGTHPYMFNLFRSQFSLRHGIDWLLG